MDEYQEDVAVDVNTEVEETTYSNENSYEDTTAKDEEIEKLRKANNQILARAKRAEDELKKSKVQPHINSNPLSEELKLIARGLSDEEIEKAKVIAKGNGTTLQDALKDDMFIAYQTKLKEDKRREDAKLGASRGSGESPDSALIKEDMTREEHQQAFRKMMGS